MNIEVWLPYIAEYSFPVVVTFYLLHRLEQKLDHVIVAVEQLPNKMKPE
ncbi:YvrJ family protein [Alkalihalobacillus pseudalcaliphilus]|nr:YvrJ family protein [Alkalihalobacillus pseudalcaliphilus]